MKQIFIIANWKSYKTSDEATQWLHQISNIKYQISNIKSAEVILCPAFTLLAQVSWFIKENPIPIKVGAQDISPFGEGAYTGEVSAKQLAEYVGYSIIGHSERRRLLGENDEVLAKKVQEAIQNKIIPIYCVQSHKEPVPVGVEIVAYEPANAIGRGTPDTPESVVEVAKKIRGMYPMIKYVLYGGSVGIETVQQFTKQPELDGVLVGGASLDPLKFFQIIQNA